MAVDVSHLRAGQRVRATFGDTVVEGVLEDYAFDGYLAILVALGGWVAVTRLASAVSGLTDVEVLSEPTPAWVTSPFSAVEDRLLNHVWVRFQDGYPQAWRCDNGATMTDAQMAATAADPSKTLCVLHDTSTCGGGPAVEQ